MEKEIKFKLPESVEFPQVIFEDALSLESVKTKLEESGFIAVQQKNVKASRIMDADEISEIRAEYGEIAETDLPSLYAEQSDIESSYKYQKKEIEGRISSAMTKFKDLVSVTKKGVKDFDLDYENTFCISVQKHYLFYTWVNGRFELALVQEIPNHNGLDIFNSIEKNKEIFEALGYQLPEVEIKDERVNFRQFFNENDGTVVEAWEENGRIEVRRNWIEDFEDNDTGEITTIPRREQLFFQEEDYPYKEIDPFYNEQAENQTGATDDVPEETTE